MLHVSSFACSVAYINDFITRRGFFFCNKKETICWHDFWCLINSPSWPGKCELLLSFLSSAMNLSGSRKKKGEEGAGGGVKIYSWKPNSNLRSWRRFWNSIYFNEYIIYKLYAINLELNKLFAEIHIALKGAFQISGFWKGCGVIDSVT